MRPITSAIARAIRRTFSLPPPPGCRGFRTHVAAPPLSSAVLGAPPSRSSGSSSSRASPPLMCTCRPICPTTPGIRAGDGVSSAASGRNSIFSTRVAVQIVDVRLEAGEVADVRPSTVVMMNCARTAARARRSAARSTPACRCAAAARSSSWSAARGSGACPKSCERARRSVRPGRGRDSDS